VATDGQTSVIDEVVADKPYHSNQVLVDLPYTAIRSLSTPHHTAARPPRLRGADHRKKLNSASRASLRRRWLG